MSADDDEYTLKSNEAGRMGKAVEHLVAAFCILATRGELNVSTSIVDDEGVRTTDGEVIASRQRIFRSRSSNG